jgi:hypothetical protein
MFISIHLYNISIARQHLAFQNSNPECKTGSFYRGSGVMLQTLIPSGAFIAGFCIRGEQELIACSKGGPK